MHTNSDHTPDRLWRASPRPVSGASDDAASSPSRARGDQRRGAITTDAAGVILLVDDDWFSQKLYTSSLSRAGHTVECVDNPDDALSRLHRGRFDVALIDVSVHNGRGIELLDTIRARLAAGALPRAPEIIMQSPVDDSGARARCINGGARRFFIKPVARTLLLKEIQASIRDVRGERT